MTKKITRILALLCVTALLSTAAVVAFADQPLWSEVTIQKEYAYGETFTVPERIVTVGGQTVTATHTVVYPDGSSTLKSVLNLNMSGVYTLCYQAMVDGKPYIEELQFLVKDYLYYFDTDKSSAVYKAGKGLQIALAEGDTIYFNAIIDMNTVSVDDLLLEAFATPAEEERFDFKRLYFTFTDVEDPGKTLTFSARHSASTVDSPYTYAMVAGNGQILTGLEPWDGDIKKHVEGTSNFGLPFLHSFKDSTKGTIQFRYDGASMTAYAGSRSIAVLNNPEHFSALWSGFTSGRVRLSITAGMYESTTARFCLKSLKGVDLSVGTLEDSEGPEIQIDSPSAIPAAAVGCSYRVFPATAKDANTGICQVKTTVWYNYTAPNAVMVNITDGQFRTDRVGNYAIVYEASDRLGNVTEQVVWVYAHEAVNKPTVTLTKAPASSLTLGQLLIPAQYKPISYSGDAKTAITATLDGVEFDLAGGNFRPEKAGVYTVTYTVTDYIGQTGTATYQVEAKPGDKPVFVDMPVFPEVLIAGCSYELPELYANDYRSGVLERKKADGQLTDAEGSRQVDGSFIPQVAANGDTVTVVYTCDGAALEVKIPVILPWYTEENSSRPKLCLENYLYSAQNDLHTVKNDASVTVAAVTADAGWVFANQMIAEKLELKFRAIAEKSNFDALHITLTDALDPTVSVTVRLVNNGKDKAQVVIGESKGTVASSFGLGSEFIVGYSNSAIFIGGTAFEIPDFAGFPSERITVKMNFAGASQGAAYDLISLCGYAMSNLTSDRTGPNIVVLGEYGGSYSIGQELVIPVALSADVLDANVTFHITVTDPAGQVVTALDGTKLSQADPTVSYTVKLDQYGQYNVRLVAADTFNGKANETILPYTINVDDEEKPKLTFTGELAAAAKVGDILVLPSFTVTDNVTAQENILIRKYVYTPEGRLLTMTGAENAIQAATAGVYEFRIYVSDEAGNMTLLRKAVTVSESEGES